MSLITDLIGFDMDDLIQREFINLILILFVRLLEERAYTGVPYLSMFRVARQDLVMLRSK